MKRIWLALIWLTFVSTAAAGAASQDGNIEWDGLFHDQGALFASPGEPGAHSPVLLRFRAFKNDLTSCTVKYFDTADHRFHTLPMTKEIPHGNSLFDYWNATVPAGSAKKYYRFCLRDGASTVWFNARGVIQAEPGDGDFQIIPEFKTPDWMKNGVIYQIYPDRFYNGDTTNDVKSGQYTHAGISTSQRKWGESPLPKEGEDRSFTFYGGDLQGVIAKLDYIRSRLGANIVYLNPIFKAPSNHKYDTADYDMVDPAFGTNDTLAILSSSLHKVLNGKRGYLVLDGVFNHTGDGHKWFAKYDAVPGVPGAYQSKKSPFFSYYNFKKWPNDYAHFLIYDSLPKLNFGSDELRKAIYKSPDSVAQRYLKPPYSIDGWRLDAPKYADANGLDGSDNFNHSIWRQFRNSVKAVNSQAVILGENWENASSWTAGGDQWDSVTNFNAFTAPVSEWITGKKVDDSRGPISTTEFEKMLRLTRAEYPTNVQQVLSNHLSNHDISRFAERAGGDRDKLRLALIFQMTYIGTPTIYYGDEYGMRGGGDPDCRRTFDWTQLSPDNKLIALTHQLISIRAKYPSLRTGSVVPLLKNDTDSVFAFGRIDKQNQIAVVLNNSNSDKTVEVPLKMLDVPDTAVVHDELTGKVYTVQSGNVTVTVPSRNGAILVH
ncbi:MAG TPA: alpha amylase N-terminal ig-like domain-containing protein [Drouetiella sp.]